jgi:hypothetical protein
MFALRAEKLADTARTEMTGRRMTQLTGVLTDAGRGESKLIEPAHLTWKLRAITLFSRLVRLLEVMQVTAETGASRPQI